MSVGTRNPLRMAGAAYSGTVNDGSFPTYRGGQKVATIWSGGVAPNLSQCDSSAVVSGNSVLLISGPGRLNSILPLVQMQSGLAAFFYDANAITVSGVSVSGQKIVGILPPTFGGGAVTSSGTVPIPAVQTGEPIRPEMPFFNGLCVSAPSGTPGFSVSYTVDASPTFG